MTACPPKAVGSVLQWASGCHPPGAPGICLPMVAIRINSSVLVWSLGTGALSARAISYLVAGHSAQLHVDVDGTRSRVKVRPDRGSRAAGYLALLGPYSRKHLETNDGTEASAVTAPAPAGQLRLIGIITRPPATHHDGNMASCRCSSDDEGDDAEVHEVHESTKHETA